MAHHTFQCPVCSAWTDILESRKVTPTTQRRRYQCANNHRFITVSEEVVESIKEGTSYVPYKQYDKENHNSRNGT